MIDREKDILEKSKKTYNRGMIIVILVNLMNIGLFFLILNAENKSFGHYIGLVVLILIQLLNIFMIRYGRKLRKNSIKTVVDFFKQNPEYRHYYSSKDINKNISIVGNYIFLIKSAKIIDINKGNNFEIWKSTLGRHRPIYYTLDFDEDGEKNNVFLGTLSSIEIQKLEHYISRYGKLKASLNSSL